MLDRQKNYHPLRVTETLFREPHREKHSHTPPIYARPAEELPPAQGISGPEFSPAQTTPRKNDSR
ncbi:hypothetical protein KC19_8G150700 [Ceratodon purpureus]|uniref:Uncharacterized protein n=1 Tax=Ceratodon purpureus TaxID=3225 RepID=A0A8T0GYP8_CERPU|nr:hypothetical protein KC19_8G150700 [Ceratodon purpureus]